MAQRIKGQEVELLLLRDGTPIDNLTNVRNFEVTFKTTIIEEKYLGETSNKYDTVFEGVSGNMEFHFDSPVVFEIIDGVVKRAQRRVPGEIINVKAALNFPSGRRLRLAFPDVQFNTMPISFGSRTDYGTFKIDWACGAYTVLS